MTLNVFLSKYHAFQHLSAIDEKKSSNYLSMFCMYWKHKLFDFQPVHHLNRATPSSLIHPITEFEGLNAANTMLYISKD